MHRVWSSLLLASLPYVHGAFYERADDVPSLDVDFIVVGGGTAGGVIANRLSENPDVQVLLLESGPTDKGVVDFEIPDRCHTMVPNTAYDYNFTTIPQKALNDRSLTFVQGHVIGGGSTVNCMVYTRGSSDDFDRYASVTGDEGWAWDNIMPYMKRGESFTDPVDKHNTAGEYNPEAHGTDGPLGVSLPGFSLSADARAFAAGAEVGRGWEYNLDMNSGYMLGFGWAQSTIKGGVRSSSASSYLGPSYISRPNLHVLLNAHVTKVLPTSPSDSGEKAFRKLEFTQDNGATFRTASVKNEIVLSAGVVGSPRILLNSGIGPSGELEVVGITPLHDLPSVGKNITEQPSTRFEYLVNTTDTQDTPKRSKEVWEERLSQWTNEKQGNLAVQPINTIGWFRLDDEDPIFQKYPDFAAGPTSPHYEIYLWNGLPYRPLPTYGNNFLTVGTTVLSTLSDGSVTLRSNNPLDPPVLDLQLLANEFEMHTMREAFRNVDKFVNSKAWDGHIVSAEQKFANDEELDEWIRSQTVMANHPSGGCQMSAKDATYGVVDPDLRVKGVEGLIVADISILPFCPAAHTMATVYAIAERASDVIREPYQDKLGRGWNLYNAPPSMGQEPLQPPGTTHTEL